MLSTPAQTETRTFVLNTDVLEAFPSAVAISDVHTSAIVLYNKKAVDIWGKIPGTAQTRKEFYSDFTFYTLDGQELPYELTPTELAQKTREAVYNRDLILKRGDGKKRHVLISAQLISDTNGEYTGVLTVFEDVAQNHKTNVALQETEKFRLAAENTNEAVWDLHIATDHMDWNKAITTLYGYRPEDVELTGTWWMGHIHPEDQPKVTASIEQTLRSQSLAWHCEYRFKRKDGSYAHTVDRGYVMRTENGTPIRMIGAMQDISKNIEAAAQLRKQALHDALTGLPNRMLIEERLEEVVCAEAAVHAIMFIDVDDFKTINDTHGHDSGDELLKAVATRLQQGVPHAFVGRLAGDEFIVITAVASKREAAEKAEQLLRAVQLPMVLAHDEIDISISIGVTMYPSDGASISGLLKNADRALYKAKRSGKGKSFFYT